MRIFILRMGVLTTTFKIHSHSFLDHLEVLNLDLRAVEVAGIVMEKEYFINKALHPRLTTAPF